MSRLKKIMHGRNKRRMQRGLPPIIPANLRKPKKEQDASYYDERIPEDLTKNVHWRRLYDKVISLLPPADSGVRIAELGCGPGFLASLLHEAGYLDYWGVDFSGECLKQAQEKVPSYVFVEGSLYDEDIQKDFELHDVFIILDTLEHLEKDLEVLDAIPLGKTIILSVPNNAEPDHVRIFGGHGEVRERYESLIEIEDIVSIYRGRRKIYFFLAYGKRNDSKLYS